MLRNSKLSPTFMRHLPLAIFLFPVITVNLAYIIASTLDHIPDCITYFSGCTSISSTGRVMPQKGIFLLGMIPTAILSMVFWQHAENWLVRKRNSPDNASKTLVYSGAIASFFLTIYVTTLGIPGEVYTLTRKFAVLLYFGFTFIAQLLLVQRLLELSNQTTDPSIYRLATQLKALCVAILAMGIVIVPISLIEDPILRKKVENVVEWNYALALYLYYLLVYRDWRRVTTAEPLTVNS